MLRWKFFSFDQFCNSWPCFGCIFMHDCLFDSSLANHELSYIRKYISITYALDSVHEKIDEWTEADILPFYPTSPVGKNGTVDPNTNLPILIDSYIELFMYLIATWGSVHEKFDVWTGPKSVCMGESWPWSRVQTSLRLVYTYDLGQDSPIQTSCSVNKS